jgi:hypothetical protein
MSFIPISIEKYIKLHLVSNPGENARELRARLNAALDAFDNGIKCECGNDIWVIGSAFTGYRCFTCITGEGHPSGDYEIDTAINKIDRMGRRHIDEMDPSKIGGFFDDDGYEIDPDQIEMPLLCLSCRKHYKPDPEDDILCNLKRIDQNGNSSFNCHSFEEI